MDSGMHTITSDGSPADPVQFTGRRGELIWLLLKNFVLNIVTLGIYRFWARTRLRAYFWRNVEVAGEALEYTGRGLELFVGFLIVVAVLSVLAIPFMVAAYLLQAAAGWLQVAMQMLYYLVIFLLVQVAIYRARRYRTTRTVWRGIRFGLDGDAKRYTWISSIYLVLTVVTLGLANPWRRVALQRYLVDNTRFGTQHFRFDGNGRDLFPIWAIVAVSWIVVAAITIGLNQPFFTEWTNSIATVTSPEEQQAAGLRLATAMANFIWWPLLLIPVTIVLRLWYSVREFTYFVNRMTFGDVNFTSSLGTPQVIWYLVIYGVLMIVGFAITAAIFFGVITATATGGAGVQALQAISPFMFVILVFALFAFMNILRVAWLYFQLIHVACRTLTIGNIATVEQVIQAADDSDRFGEGLADVLDYGDI